MYVNPNDFTGTNNTERGKPGWVFWGWWFLASTLVPAVGLAMLLFAWLVIASGNLTHGKGIEILLVGIPLLFASIGIAQWLVLRRQVSEPGWWVLSSTVGGVVGLVVGLIVGGAVGGVAVEAVGELADGNVVGGLVGFAAFGASVGIAQWFVLRRKVSRAGWWVLASTVGVVVPVVGYGAITGAALVWLLRQPVPEEARPPQDAA